MRIWDEGCCPNPTRTSDERSGQRRGRTAHTTAAAGLVDNKDRVPTAWCLNHHYQLSCAMDKMPNASYRGVCSYLFRDDAMMMAMVTRPCINSETGNSRRELYKCVSISHGAKRCGLPQPSRATGEKSNQPFVTWWVLVSCLMLLPCLCLPIFENPHLWAPFQSFRCSYNQNHLLTQGDDLWMDIYFSLSGLFWVLKLYPFGKHNNMKGNIGTWHTCQSEDPVSSYPMRIQ